MPTFAATTFVKNIWRNFLFVNICDVGYYREIGPKISTSKVSGHWQLSFDIFYRAFSYVKKSPQWKIQIHW